MIVENFVVGELRKQTGRSERGKSFSFSYADRHGEVDLILEAAGGEAVGIAIKAGGNAGAGAFKGLRVLEVSLWGRNSSAASFSAPEKKASHSAKRCSPCRCNRCGCHKLSPL